VVLLHDAQVWDAPNSYGRAFRTWYALMHPVVARRALVLATVSRHSAQRLTEHGVTRRSDIAVIGNGLDHILSTPADTRVADDLGHFVLTMGSAQPHKRTGFLLDIFADERLADVTLAVTGALPETTAVPSNVRPVGPVSDEVLRGLFQKADLFLFPSQTEGFGLPPGEAILCGCAAVISSGGALGEVYDGAARLLDQDDREAWIRTIRALLDDPAARCTLVAQGRATISGLTWEASAESLLDAMAAAAGADRVVPPMPKGHSAAPPG
jgi:glycosyltransferase involved in cell wall biosynthesis